MAELIRYYSHCRNKPAAGFGVAGIVDLKAGVTDAFPRVSLPISSPPAIYKHLVIVGGSTPDGPSLGPSGDPRAYDLRTGQPYFIVRRQRA